MHRSRVTDLLISIVGGFLSSLSTLLLIPYLRPGQFTGQIVAGNQAANRELPTTLNMMHAAMDGTNTIASDITSYGMWVAVLIGTMIGSVVIFRILRQYV